jgi:hypothetical protein
MTRVESVCMTMPFSAGVEQDATRALAPTASTRHTRQAPVGVHPFRWHRVGMLMPFAWATSRIVWPASNDSCLPFMVSDNVLMLNSFL